MQARMPALLARLQRANTHPLDPGGLRFATTTGYFLSNPPGCNPPRSTTESQVLRNLCNLRIGTALLLKSPCSRFSKQFLERFVCLFDGALGVFHQLRRLLNLNCDASHALGRIFRCGSGFLPALLSLATLLLGLLRLRVSFFLRCLQTLCSSSGFDQHSPGVLQ